MCANRNTSCKRGTHPIDQKIANHLTSLPRFLRKLEQQSTRTTRVTSNRTHNTRIKKSAHKRRSPVTRSCKEAACVSPTAVHCSILSVIIAQPLARYAARTSSQAGADKRSLSASHTFHPHILLTSLHLSSPFAKAWKRTIAAVTGCGFSTIATPTVPGGTHPLASLQHLQTDEASNLN